MADVKYSDVNNLLNSFNSEVVKLGYLERTAFDQISVSVLGFLIDRAMKNNTDHFRISLFMMGKVLRTTKMRLRTRLKHLARYGLIHAHLKCRNDGSGLKENTTYTVNPVILAMLNPKSGVRRRISVIRHYAKMGFERLDSDNDVQGFKNDCAYGNLEPKKKAEPIKPEQEIVDILTLNDDKAAKKAAEAKLWRERDNAFITSSAHLWVYMQSQNGFGTTRPNWEGDPSTLSPAARRERSELCKTFQRYGCRVTGLAWYIFTAGVPKLGSNGKPEFTLTEPHIQFATVDKKPSSFAKHLNALLNDNIFRQLATQFWDQTEKGLKLYYENQMPIGPRHETEFAMIGFEFGNNNNNNNEG